MINFPNNPTFLNTFSFSNNPTFPSIFSFPGDLANPIAFHSDTLNWRDRAVTSGGIIDNIDLIKLNLFVEKMHELGLRDNVNNNHILLEFLPLVGGNLQAALTPLWFYPNLPTVTNFGFTESNYNRELGLTSDVFTYLESNIRPSLHLNFSSLSIGLYNNISVSSPSNEIISDSTQDGNNRLLMHTHFGDNNIYFDVGDAFQGRTVAGTNDDSQGLIVGSKLSANKSSIFRRGAEIGSSNTEGGTLPFKRLSYFKCHSNGEFNFTKTFGLVFVGQGIPLDRHVAFNDAVQNFMTSLGR